MTTFQAPSTLPIHVNTAHHRLGRVAEKTSNRVKRAEELLRRRANDEPLELMGALILVGRPLEPAVLVEKPQPTG